MFASVPSAGPFEERPDANLRRILASSRSTRVDSSSCYHVDDVKVIHEWMNINR